VPAYQEVVNLDLALSLESADVSTDLNDLASAERAFGDYAAAERHYREAPRMAKKVNYREGVAYVTGNLADLALKREQWAEAEQLAREAVSLSEKLGRQELIAYYSRVLAKSCARQGRRSEGLPYAQRAVAIFTKLRSPGLEKAQAVLKECEG
jgi:tetratricopeptide (TPR) repeat protein